MASGIPNMPNYTIGGRDLGVNTPMVDNSSTINTANNTPGISIPGGGIWNPPPPNPWEGPNPSTYDNAYGYYFRNKQPGPSLTYSPTNPEEVKYLTDWHTSELGNEPWNRYWNNNNQLGNLTGKPTDIPMYSDPNVVSIVPEGEGWRVTYRDGTSQHKEDSRTGFETWGPVLGDVTKYGSLALLTYLTAGAASGVGGGVAGAEVGAGMGGVTGFASSGGNPKAALTGAVAGGVGGYLAPAAAGPGLTGAGAAGAKAGAEAQGAILYGTGTKAAAAYAAAAAAAVDAGRSASEIIAAAKAAGSAAMNGAIPTASGSKVGPFGRWTLSQGIRTGTTALVGGDNGAVPIQQAPDPYANLKRVVFGSNIRPTVSSRQQRTSLMGFGVPYARTQEELS